MGGGRAVRHTRTFNPGGFGCSRCPPLGKHRVSVTIAPGQGSHEAEAFDMEVVTMAGSLKREAKSVEVFRSDVRRLRFGSFTRTLPLPEGVSEDDVTAGYEDGILEIRIPAHVPEPARKIAKSKT